MVTPHHFFSGQPRHIKPPLWEELPESWSFRQSVWKLIKAPPDLTFQHIRMLVKRFCFLGNVGWQSVAHNSWMIQGFEHVRNGECSFSAATAAKAVVLRWKESAHKCLETETGSFLFYACNMPFLMLQRPQPILFEDAYIIPKTWWKNMSSVQRVTVPMCIVKVWTRRRLMRAAGFWKRRKLSWTVRGRYCRDHLIYKGSDVPYKCLITVWAPSR